MLEQGWNGTEGTEDIQANQFGPFSRPRMLGHNMGIRPVYVGAFFQVKIVYQSALGLKK